MNLINQHLDKNNLHHAYLLEGKKEEILPEILNFVRSLGVEIHGNLDFFQITLDTFKIEDARNLKAQSIERGITGSLPNGQSGKKVFIISVNNFLIEAQNTLLKMFEEPIENTMFFLIVPDSAIILPTLLSRVYLIKSEVNLESGRVEAQKFLKLSCPERIVFIKEFIAEGKEEEDTEENISGDSVRSKSIKLLNVLEMILHEELVSKKILQGNVDFFEQIFKAREYLRQPGSSTKNLMESVALSTPQISF
jgi:DNA polymerase III delta prime subunit